MATLLIDNGAHAIADSACRGDELWLDIDSLEETAGWTLKPEGVCRDEVCVPLPRGREGDFVDRGRFNMAAFARHMGQPVLQDAASHSWANGEEERVHLAAFLKNVEHLIGPLV